MRWLCVCLDLCQGAFFLGWKFLFGSQLAAPHLWFFYTPRRTLLDFLDSFSVSLFTASCPPASSPTGLFTHMHTRSMAVLWAQNAALSLHLYINMGMCMHRLYTGQKVQANEVSLALFGVLQRFSYLLFLPTLRPFQQCHGFHHPFQVPFFNWQLQAPAAAASTCSSRMQPQAVLGSCRWGFCRMPLHAAEQNFDLGCHAAAGRRTGF